MGFADAENSVEPIVFQAQHHGWLAVLQAMGVAEDSPLRNPEQIPYLTPTPLSKAREAVVMKRRPSA